MAPAERRERSTIAALHGKADAPHLGGVQRAAGNAPQVAGVVGAQDLGVAGRVGDAEVVVGEQAAVVQARAQQREYFSIGKRWPSGRGSTKWSA